VHAGGAAHTRSVQLHLGSHRPSDFPAPAGHTTFRTHTSPTGRVVAADEIRGGVPDSGLVRHAASVGQQRGRSR
jgi:hypothetical protein